MCTWGVLLELQSPPSFIEPLFEPQGSNNLVPMVGVWQESEKSPSFLRWGSDGVLDVIVIFNSTINTHRLTNSTDNKILQNDITSIYGNVCCTSKHTHPYLSTTSHYIPFEASSGIVPLSEMMLSGNCHCIP